MSQAATHLLRSPALPKLTEVIADSIARCATNEIMERLEQHVEAHPVRYGGREVSDEAYELLRRRIERSQLALLREIEIPPR